MVWTQDRLKDRQRVVHWDLLRSGPDHAMERVIDMFSAGDQRIYNGYNQGRINIPKTAFKDGNFSLVIKGEILFGNTKATAWNSIEIFTLQKISDVAFLDKWIHFVWVHTDVAMSDKGIYSCNLHHHYCHLYESINVQLNVTKSGW